MYIKKGSRLHHHFRHAEDWLVSRFMMDHAIRAIRQRTRIDRAHDIPYLAGYSRDGKTIYIDRHMPKSFAGKGRRISTDRFLLVHEAVEKALIQMLGLHYQHAHQIALRAEQAAVRAEGIEWTAYDAFMQRYIKQIGDERLARVPADLDQTPYRDEHDFALLQRMQAHTGRAPARRGRGAIKARKATSRTRRTPNGKRPAAK